MKFFRGFRKNSLANTRFARYLIYAIGEIILVVIGILIALQVNNWNENRKILKLREGFTVTIINDLERDSINLQRYIDQMRRDSIVLRSLETRMQASENKPDTAKKIFRYDFPYYVRPDHSFNNNTIVAILENNNDLYPEEVIAQMVDLVKVQRDFQETNKLTIDKYLSILHRSNNYAFENYLFDGGKEMRDEIWASVDTMEILKDFEQIADWKMAYTHLVLAYAKGLQRYCHILKTNLQELDSSD